jgi:hypothetical protein
VHAFLTTPSPPHYLSTSDQTSKEFFMYNLLEIDSLLNPSLCGDGRPFLRHARPSCTHPTVDSHLKAIGACPLSVLEGVVPYDIYPPTFECPSATPYVADNFEAAREWLLAGNALMESQHYDHAIASFYQCAQSALRLDLQQLYAEALSNLAQALGVAGDAELMASGFFAALGTNKLSPGQNLATVIKMVTYVVTA